MYENKPSYRDNAKNMYPKNDDRHHLSSISIKSENLADYINPNEDNIYKQYKNNLLNQSQKSIHNQNIQKGNPDNNTIEVILPVRYHTLLNIE